MKKSSIAANKKAIADSSMIIRLREEAEQKKEREKRKEEKKQESIRHKEEMRQKKKKEAYGRVQVSLPLFIMVLLPFLFGIFFMLIVVFYTVSSDLRLDDLASIYNEKYSYLGLWSIGYCVLSVLLILYFFTGALRKDKQPSTLSLNKDKKVSK